jgi:hypothetical protein
MPITSIKWDARNLAVNSQVRAFIIATKSKTNKKPKK